MIAGDGVVVGWDAMRYTFSVQQSTTIKKKAFNKQQ